MGDKIIIQQDQAAAKMQAKANIKRDDRAEKRQISAEKRQVIKEKKQTSKGFIRNWVPLQ